MCLQNASTGQNRSRSLDLAHFFTATALTWRVSGDVSASMTLEPLPGVEAAL
jgi:hypothetical protein